MHPIWLLAFVTLVAVAGFGWWSYMSTKKHQESGGGHTTGVGGPTDPLAGSTDKVRSPDELRAALDSRAADKRYEA